MKPRMGTVYGISGQTHHFFHTNSNVWATLSHFMTVIDNNTMVVDWQYTIAKSILVHHTGS